MQYKRIIVSHYGGPDTLEVIEEKCPEPKRGQALVRVLAAGVALPDVIHLETPLCHSPRLGSGRPRGPARPPCLRNRTSEGSAVDRMTACLDQRKMLDSTP